MVEKLAINPLIAWPNLWIWPCELSSRIVRSSPDSMDRSWWPNPCQRKRVNRLQKDYVCLNWERLFKRNWEQQEECHFKWNACLHLLVVNLQNTADNCDVSCFRWLLAQDENSLILCKFYNCWRTMDKLDHPCLMNMLVCKKAAWVCRVSCISCLWRCWNNVCCSAETCHQHP